VTVSFPGSTLFRGVITILEFSYIGCCVQVRSVDVDLAPGVCITGASPDTPVMLSKAYVAMSNIPCNLIVISLYFNIF
jgi:hypothetical protein